MICAIVLAAGRSERMGTQKLLLPLEGKAVIAHIVDELSCSQVDQIHIVIGRDGNRLRETLADKPVRFIKNPDPTSDMLGSVRSGLAAVSSDCAAALVVLGDQPGITHELVNELIAAYREGEHKIIVPTCNGHRGHPVLFGSQYFDEVLTNHTTTGLRGFLDAHGKEVLRVTVSDLTAMEDMDTPGDYQRQEKLFADRYADTVWLP